MKRMFLLCFLLVTVAASSVFAQSYSVLRELQKTLNSPDYIACKQAIRAADFVVEYDKIIRNTGPGYTRQQYITRLKMRYDGKLGQFTGLVSSIIIDMAAGKNVDQKLQRLTEQGRNYCLKQY